MSERKIGDLRVWWVPQIPMKEFTVDVADLREGVKIMSVLAEAFRAAARAEREFMESLLPEGER